jgi:peptidoglycan/LPS O-acetylase OafA/YrhL
MTDATLSITVRKRPWWTWLAAAAWLLVEILLVQTAIASGWEEEPRAAAISWVLAVALVIAGLAAWTRGARRARGAAGDRDRQPEGHDER